MVPVVAVRRAALVSLLTDTGGGGSAGHVEDGRRRFDHGHLHHGVVLHKDRGGWADADAGRHDQDKETYLDGHY